MAESPDEKHDSAVNSIFHFFVPERKAAQDMLKEVLSGPETIPGHVAKRLLIMAGLAVGFPGWAAITGYTSLQKTLTGIKERPNKIAAEEQARLAPFVKAEKQRSEKERMSVVLASARQKVGQIGDLLRNANGNAANVRIDMKDPLNAMAEIAVSFFPDKAPESAALYSKMKPLRDSKSGGKGNEAPLATIDNFNLLVGSKLDMELAEVIFKEMVNRYKGEPPTEEVQNFIKDEFRPLLVKIIQTQMAEKKISEIKAKLSSLTTKINNLGDNAAGALGGKVKYEEYQALQDIAFARNDVTKFSIAQSMMSDAQNTRFVEQVKIAAELVGKVNPDLVEPEDDSAAAQRYMLEDLVSRNQFEP